MTELTKAIEGIGENFAAFKNTTGKQVNDLDDRVGRIEALADRPGMPTKDGVVQDKNQVEHKTRFEAWLRDPCGHAQKTQLAEAESELSQKAVTIGTSSSGGYAVPAIIASASTSASSSSVKPPSLSVRYRFPKRFGPARTGTPRNEPIWG